MNNIEWKSFKKFISKYSNSTLLLKLILFIEKNKFDFTNKAIYKFLYNSDDININKLRQLFNRLKTETNKFHLHQIDQKKTILLNEHYKYKNINTLQKKTIKSLNSIYDSINSQSSDSLALAYYLAIDSEKHHREQNDIEHISNKLDEHYIIEKLKITCSSYTSKNILQINHQIKGIDYLEKLLENYQENQLLQIWYQALLITRDKNQNAYFKTKAFFDTKNSIDTEEKKQLFTILINFCIANINLGLLDWFSELYDIYLLQIKHDAIYNQHQLLEYATYKNIITTSLHQNQFGWSEKFLEKYKSKLNPTEREANYLYNKARIYFAKKEYNKVLPLLIGFKSDDFFIEIANKVLLIKTFYEMEEYNILSSTLDSFRIYLLRYKNKNYHYLLHMNFIKILNKIIKIRLNKKVKSTLIEKINTTSQVAEKTWLLSLLQ